MHAIKTINFSMHSLKINFIPEKIKLGLKVIE
jgi:hypothetical protein